ncbi:MAG TPA: hypothetical protein VH136_06180 [Trebonia sp.]|nr:hypothetical protein [Trebonia sp.]
MRPRPSGAAVLFAALAAAVALAGCGTQDSGRAGSGTTSAAATTSAPAAPTSSATATGQGTGGAATPAGGPVPTGMAATSVTFVSPDEAFVLGTAPCSHTPCTSIVRTLNRGASWRGLPAPVVPLGQPENGPAPAVWGIRFATPSHGFVFGTGLWETTDGGEQWAKASSPAGSILSLEVIDGQVLALTATCSSQSGCGTATLVRRPVGGGTWQPVTQLHVSGSTGDRIATQARVAAILDGSSVIVTANGGLSTLEHATPCTTQGVAYATSVAVTGPDSLALLCSGGAAMGSVIKTIYVSSNLGQHWTKAGAPPRGGDPISIAGATPGQLVVSAASGASWLYYSGNGAAQWGSAYEAGDGGMGFNDLGFTTTSDGVVVYGPAVTDGNGEGRPGRLLLTSNGGASWRAVSF